MRKDQQRTEGDALPILDGVSLARITPPIAVPHFLARHHLIERLNKPAPHATFIVAPSGYGKTTLAVQLLNEISIPAIWYSVDKNDTPRDTAFNVISAARRAIPTFAPWAESYFQTDFNLIDWTVRLCNEIGKVSSEVFIVWDGADNFSPDHLQMTQAFIDNSPANLRFISLRKVMPQVSYSRLASFDALTFISAADLKFTDDEVQFIAERAGLDTNLPEIKSALAAAQGWPAGVQLLAKELSQSAKPKSPGLFDGRTIVKSAVENLPSEDRAFLEALVFLDAIRDSDAIEITGEADAQIRLERMSQEGLFVSRIADDVPIYRINSLIKEVLQESLASDKKTWKARALQSAEISLRSGQDLHAVEIYSLIGEEDEARKIAVKNIQTMMTQANSRLLRKWAPKIGENFDIPELGDKVLQLYAELSVGNIEQAQVILSAIETDPTLSVHLEKYNREVLLAKARIAFSKGHFAQVVEYLAQEPNSGVFDEVGQITRKISGYRPALMASFIMQDRVTFLKFFDKSVSLAEPSDKYVQKITLPSMRSMHAFLQGRYLDAHESAQLALHTAKEFGVRGLFIPFEAAYVLADVALEFGEEEKSLAIVDEYLPLAISAQQWPWVVGLLSKAALVRVQQGRVNEALNLIRQARESVSGPRFGEHITYLADGHELLARLALNDFERIMELIYRLPPNEDTQFLLIGLEARKNPADAPKLLAGLPEATDHQKFRKALFLSMASVQNRPQAMKYLEQALEIGVANGYFRAFINMPSEVKTLILDLAVKNPTVYMENLAKAIRKQSQIVMNESAGSENPLTKRELDILRRLSTGLPITQIAASLHISNNTIKTHLKNVYRKMGVASREEAVARGQELLLL